MKQQYVWVVVSGSYDDERAVCVCDTRERAEHVAQLLNEDEDYWAHDARAEPLPLVDFEPERVTVYFKNVNVYDSGRCEDLRSLARERYPFIVDNPAELQPAAWRWVRAPVFKGAGGRLEVYGTDAKLVARMLEAKQAELLSDDELRGRAEMRGRE